MANPANPAVSGAVTFDKVVYAASQLNYGANPRLNQYAVFDTPTPAYVTRRVDLSAFADLGAFTPWPFSNTNVPINGLACLPHGAGPFPLAIFAHGNHDPFENSTPGYLYLCELLASHGIAAATVDVNFLNGQNFGENDGRAIIHLEHIRQFALWNAQPGHPLFERIDQDRIMIVGHSRGGEAVGHASVFNRLTSVQPDSGSPPVALDGTSGLGPYRFSIRAAVAIAPTDKQYVPVSGPSRVADNYLILHGSRDNDVSNFPGYKTYDRSHPVDLQNPTAPPDGYKALLWVHHANHNFFNSVWGQESAAPTLARPDQELIAKIYIASFAFAELKGLNAYLDVLKDPRLAATAGWLPPGVVLATQFQPAHRVFVQHFEEPGNAVVVSAPVTGSAGAVGAVPQKLRFDLGSTSHLYQETSGLSLSWGAQPASYEIGIDPNTVSLNSFDHFAVRVGQSSEPNNAVGHLQDFTLVFEDGANQASLTVGLLQDLAYPDSFPQLRTQPKTVMQTVIVPFGLLAAQGLNATGLRKIAFLFDQTNSGTLYVDDVQFGS